MTDQFEDAWERAGTINERLQAIARVKGVRVGFKSGTAARLAVQKLKTEDPFREFKKPLFASPEKWIRKTVVWHREAFQMLASNIELAFKAPGPAGEVNYWNGFGLPIDYGVEFKMAERGLGALQNPKLISIILFDYFGKFEDVLQPFESGDG